MKVNQPITYQAGEQKIAVEPVKDTLVIGYETEQVDQIFPILQTLGQVENNPQLQVAIIQFANESQRLAGEALFHEWIKQGLITFVTPLLRDVNSQSHQILTNEITVRFVATPASAELVAVEQQYGVVIARQNEFVPNQYIVKVTQAEGLETLEVAQKLDTADGVVFATPNFISEHKH
jgi:hypothetical protein